MPAPVEAKPPETRRVRVSPVARRIADESGVDLRTVRGTGPDGRIVRRDVEAAAGGRAGAAPAAGPAPPALAPHPHPLRPELPWSP